MTGTAPWIGWVIAAAIGYGLGAINPAAIVARTFGVDLRGVGSGNPGATNVGRAFGPRWAIVVGVADALKGFVPAYACAALFGLAAGEVAGLAAVVGHATSPFLKGRGGKGVATALGAILGIQPVLAIPVLVAFGIGVGVWRQVGLGAVLGALTLVGCAIVGFWTGWPDGVDPWFALLLGVFVLFRHQHNLRKAWSALRT